MDNQERNREALVEHIAEQDRILRRRNEQIARQAKQIENQLHNAREARRVIEEQDARNYSLAADLAAAVTRAEKAEDTLLMVQQQRDEYRAMHSEQIKTIARLQKNPRPEGAEELQALIRQAEAEGEGADNEALANYLAARLTDPTVKEQS